MGDKLEFDGEAPLPMRARVVCNRYAPGYRSVSVPIQKMNLSGYFVGNAFMRSAPPKPAGWVGWKGAMCA